VRAGDAAVEPCLNLTETQRELALGQRAEALDGTDVDPVAHPVERTLRNLREVDVVVAELGLVDGAAEVRAVDEHVEVGAGGRRPVVVGDDAVIAAGQVNAETFARALDVGRPRPEQGHVVARFREHLCDGAVDLLATAERRPVQVVHGDSKRRHRDSPRRTFAS